MIYVIWVLITAFVILFDQITKIAAVRYLAPIGSYPLIKDVFHLTYVENRGAAFGILKDQRWIFMVATVVLIICVIIFMLKNKNKLSVLMQIGLCFVIGGGIGNMIDRTINGFVVDFFDFTLINFAVFNIADTFVCIGVGLVALDILLGKSHFEFLDSKKDGQDNNDEADL